MRSGELVDAGLPRAKRILETLARKFVDWQIEKPFQPLLVALAVTFAAALGARGLELYTQFERLLPESQPSVKEFRRVSSRLAGPSKVVVVLEGNASSTLRRLGDELTARLDEIGPPSVVHVEDGVHDARRFLLPRAALFASVDELTTIRDDLRARCDEAVG